MSGCGRCNLLKLAIFVFSGDWAEDNRVGRVRQDGAVRQIAPRLFAGLGTSPSKRTLLGSCGVLPAEGVASGRGVRPSPTQSGRLLNRSERGGRAPEELAGPVSSPGQLEPPVQLGVVSVLAVVLSCFGRFFLKKDVTATPKAPDRKIGRASGVAGRGRKGFPIGGPCALFGSSLPCLGF